MRGVEILLPDGLRDFARDMNVERIFATTLEDEVMA
jgi:hypothetical protein